jgi:hypothetical protein
MLLVGFDALCGILNVNQMSPAFDQHLFPSIYNSKIYIFDDKYLLKFAVTKRYIVISNFFACKRFVTTVDIEILLIITLLVEANVL